MSNFEFALRPGSGVPIYQQIVENIRNGIATGALQPGDHLPSVRDLAHRLGLNPSTVARAYIELEREGVIVTRRGAGSVVAERPSDLNLATLRDEQLASLLGRTVVEALSLGFEPDQVEASFALQMARWRENRSRPHVLGQAPSAESKLVFVGSHDLAVELLFSQIRRSHPDLKASAVYVGSLDGLIALQQGAAHIAGCHLLDAETGEYNVPYIHRLLPGQEVVLVTLVDRQQGLMVAKGNPERINSLVDLARPGIRFINRRRGSGTRVLLDVELRRLAISPSAISGYEREEDTHLAVASAVANGQADVGLGIYAAARSLGLDFIPVQRERYDLAMLASTYESPPIQPLLAIIRSPEFQRVVTAMGGYEVTHAGRVMRV